MGLVEGALLAAQEEPQMGLSPHPRSARPRRGRSRPPALVPRPSLNPSDPQQPQPSRDPTPLHPPDPAGPSRKHSPAGRKSARSSGLASLCPAHAPPLASRASALALSTLFLIPFQAPPDSLQKNKRSSGDAVVFSTVEDFFQAPYVPQNSPKVSTLPAGRRFVTPEREEVARPRVGPAARPPASRSGDGRRGGRREAEPRGGASAASASPRGAGRRRGARPVASPGTTVAARPAHHPGRTQAAHAPRPCPREFLFFFFPSGLFLYSFSGSWSVYTSPSRGWRCGEPGLQFPSSCAPPRASYLNRGQELWRKQHRSIQLFPSARLV